MALVDRERDLGIQKPMHDVRLEQAVLGSMLISRDAVFEARARGVTANHFYRLAHQLIFDTILSLDDALAPIDLVTLEHELRDSDRLADAGGESYIQELFDVIPTAANMRHYVDRLLKVHARRQREADAAEGLRRLREGEEAEAGALFQRAAEATAPDSVLVPRHVQLRQLREKLAAQAAGDAVGMPTGFKTLDEQLGGLARGRSYAIAGRTSEGKTAVAMQIALAVAEAGEPVHVFSKEMPHEDLNARLVTLLSGVPLPNGTALKRLGEEARERVEAAFVKLNSLPLTVDDRGLDLPRTLAEARRLKGKVSLFLIDHARLVPVPWAESEYEAVTAVSGGAKRIAIECGAAVLLVCQFNREGAKSGAPQLHHLAGSSALEQDADVALLLNRPGYCDPKSKDLSATLSVMKNRHGAGAVASLVWRPALMKFEDVTR